jgi:hypothetical protein
VLRDTTLSCFEKAIALSRTYYSVTNATRKYGYTSRVEKGDPMQGVWHIDNPNDPKQKKAA